MLYNILPLKLLSRVSSQATLVPSTMHSTAYDKLEEGGNEDPESQPLAGDPLRRFGGGSDGGTAYMNKNQSLWRRKWFYAREHWRDVLVSCPFPSWRSSSHAHSKLSRLATRHRFELVSVRPYCQPSWASSRVCGFCGLVRRTGDLRANDACLAGTGVAHSCRDCILKKRSRSCLGCHQCRVSCCQFGLI